MSQHITPRSPICHCDWPRCLVSIGISLLLMTMHSMVIAADEYIVDNDEVTTFIQTVSAVPVDHPAATNALGLPIARPIEGPLELPATIDRLSDRDAAPISDISSSAAISAPTDLWDRIRAGYAMENYDDDLVTKWEKFYASKPDYIARIVERSRRYMFYIVTELERRDMPLEIVLLPIIESAFNPGADSTAKATGIWQFIPSTGNRYGMKQDWWADSRRDVVSATNGALDYLSNLYGMFGDWQLALASYNWGEGAVSRAVRNARNAGKTGNYRSLQMPDETRNYLPKLQAIKNIITEPAAFGLTIASIPNEPYFKTITLANPIDLKRAVQLADMSETDFVALNPAHHRPVIGGRGEEYQILLPADRAELFLARLGSSEKPRVSWMAYLTQFGDRIEALATRFGTTASALRSANGIRSSTSQIPPGYHLLVPSDGPSEEALGSIQNAVFTKFPEYVAPRTHRVRRGETLTTIAKRYLISTNTLKEWNQQLRNRPMRTGQMLYISGPAVRVQLNAKVNQSKQGRVVQVNKITVRNRNAPKNVKVVKTRNVETTTSKRVAEKRPKASNKTTARKKK